MKSEKGDIIWKDKKLLLAIVTTFFGLIFIFFIFVFLSDGGELIDKIVVFASEVFILLIIYPVVTTKLTRIHTKGIDLGNIPYAKKRAFFTLTKRNFLKWKDIKSLKFKTHSIGYGWRKLPFNYLTIAIKNNKEECLIYSSEGFKEALRKLNKYHLLS